VEPTCGIPLNKWLIGKAKIPVINKCAADCDLTVTGDQTSKCSEKQYKYEEKICGWQPTVASMLE
jgi:hypothetical protein